MHKMDSPTKMSINEQNDVMLDRFYFVAWSEIFSTS